jgi:predicted PolB exonuclease-like 3'-5' exonuclease
MNVFIDIETIPQQPEEATKAEIAKTIEAPAAMKKAETIKAWHDGEGKYEGVKAKAIDDAYRKTSFDGAKGEICSIAWKVNDGVTSISRADYSEEEMLTVFFDTLHIDCNGRPPYFIGQYLGGFDLKFIFHRAIILGVKPPFKIPFDGRHKSDFYCTQAAWAGYGGRMSQDNLCAALGIKGKPDDIDGSKVWDFYKAGKIDRIEEYNRYDVETVETIYNRINFIGEK